MWSAWESLGHPMEKWARLPPWYLTEQFLHGPPKCKPCKIQVSYQEGEENTLFSSSFFSLSKKKGSCIVSITKSSLLITLLFQRLLLLLPQDFYLQVVKTTLTTPKLCKCLFQGCHQFAVFLPPSWPGEAEITELQQQIMHSAPQSRGRYKTFLSSTPLSPSQPLPEAHSSWFTNQREVTAANQTPSITGELLRRGGRGCAAAAVWARGHHGAPQHPPAGPSPPSMCWGPHPRESPPCDVRIMSERSKLGGPNSATSTN